MSGDRRLYHASELRAFFDEQLLHLLGLVRRFKQRLHDHRQAAAAEKQIVERFVDASNAKVRAISGYSGKLRRHVRTLYQHVLNVAEQIPEPVMLNSSAFLSDPLLNALFVYGQDIDRLFERDRTAQAYLRRHDKAAVPVVYALLTVDKYEKRGFGTGMQGQMLIRDVPQETVNFHGHKLHTPCASRDALDAALKSYLFERVVALIKQDLAARMTGPMFETLSYQAQLNSLANPDVYLRALIDSIQTPDQLVSVDKLHFRLSKLGVKLQDDDLQCANEFDIHELSWGDNSRNVLLPVVHIR